MIGIDFRSLQFAEPLYLWLLAGPALLLVLWIWQVLRRRAETRRYLRQRVSPLRERYPLVGDLAFWLCLILASSLAIVALARPQARVAAVRDTGADIVILQDGSASMSVNDVAPDRWQRSVVFLRAFAESLSWQHDRIALALFAHHAAPQLRLTRDPNALFFFLDHLRERSPFRLEDDTTWDTNIEEGIYWGVKLVEKDEEVNGRTKNAKAFLVVSDGQAWSGDVAAALEMAHERDIAVFVVGVGTTRGGLIPEPTRWDGTRLPATIPAQLDRESLRHIARAGGGDYIELGRELDRDAAVRIVRAVKRRGEAAELQERYEDLYWRFLFGTALLLCLGTLMLKERAELWSQVATALIGVLILAALADITR